MEFNMVSKMAYRDIKSVTNNKKNKTDSGFNACLDGLKRDDSTKVKKEDIDNNFNDKHVDYSKYKEVNLDADSTSRNTSEYSTEPKKEDEKEKVIKCAFNKNEISKDEAKALLENKDDLSLGELTEIISIMSNTLIPLNSLNSLNSLNISKDIVSNESLLKKIDEVIKTYTDSSRQLNLNSTSDLDNLKADLIKILKNEMPNIPPETLAKIDYKIEELLKNLKIVSSQVMGGDISNDTFEVNDSSNIEEKIVQLVNKEINISSSNDINLNIEARTLQNSINKLNDKNIVVKGQALKDIKEIVAATSEGLDNRKEIKPNVVISKDNKDFSNNSSKKGNEDTIFLKNLVPEGKTDNMSKVNFSNNSSKKGNEDTIFLKNLVSEDKTDNMSKVNLVMNQLNKLDNAKVEINTTDVKITKDNFAQDIIKAVKFVQTNDLKDLTVKVMPRELGEVIIKVSMVSGVMKTSITLNNKEAYNLISSSLQDITSKLQNTDLKVQGSNVDIYYGDTNFSREQSKENFNQQKKQNRNKEIDNPIDEISLKNENLLVVDSSINRLI